MSIYLRFVNEGNVLGTIAHDRIPGVGEKIVYENNTYEVQSEAMMTEPVRLPGGGERYVTRIAVALPKPKTVRKEVHG